MGRSLRAAECGFVYPVFNRGNARRQLFFKDGDYAAFLRVLSTLPAGLRTS
jgi:putative transposase